jgi:hypothetical protein
MDLLGIPIAIDPGEPRGLGVGKATEGGTDRRVIASVASPDPVGLIAITQREALGYDLRRYFDQQGQIRQQAAATNAVQVQHFGI